MSYKPLTFWNKKLWHTSQIWETNQCLDPHNIFCFFLFNSLFVDQIDVKLYLLFPFNRKFKKPKNLIKGIKQKVHTPNQMLLSRTSFASLTSLFNTWNPKVSSYCNDDSDNQYLWIFYEHFQWLQIISVFVSYFRMGFRGFVLNFTQKNGIFLISFDIMTCKMLSLLLHIKLYKQY